MRSETTWTILLALVVSWTESGQGQQSLPATDENTVIDTVSKSGCKEPDAPLGGTRQLFADGDSVHYCCKPYYHLVGVQDAECHNGRWSSPTPICVVAACELATPFKHGSFISRFNGGLVEFRCRRGFQLDGPQVLACIEKEWNGTEPQCIRVLKSGTSELNAREVVKYNDIHGGVNSDVHQKEKARKTHEEWLNDADYSCIKSTDQVVLPPNVPHSRHYIRWATHDGRPRLYTTYQCTWGYVPAGTSKNLYCSQGMWVGVGPKCEIFAKDDEVLQGDILVSATPLTHEALLRYADYTCIGPHLEGGSHLPPDPEHGRATLKFTILEGRPHLYSTYSCNDDYLLKDNTKAHMYCKNAAWIGDKPKCVPAAEKDPCFINNGGCQQQCGATGRCACRDGFTLSLDEHSCEDIDECLINNGDCQHLCDNTDGSYQCSCYGDYELRGDGKTCHLPSQSTDASLPAELETKPPPDTNEASDGKRLAPVETPEQPLTEVEWTGDLSLTNEERL